MKRKNQKFMTKHHVPPKCKGAKFVLDKTWEEHKAYHTVFGNAGSLEECIHILRKYWWSKPGEVP